MKRAFSCAKMQKMPRKIEPNFAPIMQKCMQKLMQKFMQKFMQKNAAIEMTKLCTNTSRANALILSQTLEGGSKNG